MPESDLLFTERLKSLWALVHPTLIGVGLAHDAEHILRVTRWAMYLASRNGIDAELAVATGLVHDLVQVPKESPNRSKGGELSAIAGREPLEIAGFLAEEIAEIVEAVRTSSWSRGLEAKTKLAEVLQDADRLDAIGAVGIARNFACAQEMAQRSGRGRFYDPEDPFAQSDRELDDARNALDHWRAKLQHLAAGMHTLEAQKEAQQRHDFLLRFESELARELISPLLENEQQRGAK